MRNVARLVHSEWQGNYTTAAGRVYGRAGAGLSYGAGQQRAHSLLSDRMHLRRHRRAHRDHASSGSQRKGRTRPQDEKASWKKVLQQRHLVKGVLAQFLYVGAQVGVGSFVIRFAQHSLPGLTARSAWYYLLGHWIGFMLGRFGGSVLMKSVPAARLLSIFGAGSLGSIIVALSVSGPASVWVLVLIGFFRSIMFPTIFALSIKNLGPLTKRGSSLQVMAIFGGRNPSRDHGAHLRCHQHPHRLHRPAPLLPLHFLFRRKRL